MANQCEGCKNQDFHKSYPWLDPLVGRRRCVACKATYKGPSNYISQRRHTYEKEPKSI